MTGQRYTLGMKEIIIKKPLKKQLKKLVKREFEIMPEFDPIFKEGALTPFRKFIWHNLGLPSLYQKSEGFLAEVDGEIAGFTFSYIRPMMLRVDSFMVEADYRKQGVGSSLLNEIEEFAREYEIRFLVNAMPRENESGYEFAQKKGFDPYRSKLMHLDGEAKLGEVSEGVEVEKVVAAIAKAQYDKFLSIELEEGDEWAKELIISEFAELGFNRVGEHFNCLKDGEVKGYLRLIKGVEKITVYLSCESEFWGDAIQLEWIRAAMERSQFEIKNIEIMFASGGHHEKARELFCSVGFKEDVRQRFLIVKDLGPFEVVED